MRDDLERLAYSAEARASRLLKHIEAELRTLAQQSDALIVEQAAAHSPPDAGRAAVQS